MSDRTALTPTQETVLAVMRRWRREGALYTSDIAHGAKVKTGEARRALNVLEQRGEVKRVLRGNPTSWILADA